MVYLLIGLLVVIAIPIAVSLVDRIAAASPRPTGRDLDLRRELDSVQAQLDDAHYRLRQLETRLDFYEKLLQERRPRGLPGPAGPE